MKDCVVFMSAFSPLNYKKVFNLFYSKLKLKVLLEKYKIDFSVCGENLVTPQGALKLKIEYDYVNQQSKYHYELVNKNHSIDDYIDSLKNLSSYINLIHANSVLADKHFFDIEQFFSLKSFLVYIDSDVFQIDPIVFMIDNTFIIAYEVIDFTTGKPMKRSDVCGKTGNFNLKKIRGFHHFQDSFSTLSTSTVPELIYDTIKNFFDEIVSKRYIADDYAYIHNTLVISSDIKNVSKYMSKLIGVKNLISIPENISTTNNYQYYVMDGSSVVTKIDPSNIDVAIYNAIVLESIKLYIYLFQIVNTDIIEDLRKATRNVLYLENLFFAPKVPIETSNYLKRIYKSDSFTLRKEANRLKLEYLTAVNESIKNRNTVSLNILLYIISLLGTISTLETFETKLGVPFTTSFFMVIGVFLAVGLVWFICEYKRNKRF